MTVQAGPTFKRYAANGVATVYTVPFLLIEAGDLEVTLNGASITSGFTLAGVGTPSSSCTFAVPPSGDLLFQLVVVQQRLFDYQENGDFLSQTVNLDFDRIWQSIKELRRDAGRALSVSELEPEGIDYLPAADLRALKLLSFDATGQPVAIAAASQSATELEIDLAAPTGAGLVGWIRSITGAIGMTLSRWLGYQPVTPLDFMTEAQRASVLASDAVEDVTAPLQAFRDHLASFAGKPPKAVIPAGLYKYSVSPNWAIDNLVVESKGSVFFRYTGTGNALIFDAGPTTEVIYGVDFGPVFIEAPPTAGHGVFVRSVHHSHIKAVVRGCGTTKHALQANFAVATTFEVIASVNENFRIPGTPVSGWYLDAKPLHGLYLDQRGAGEQVAACYFPRPIIEGVADTGIILVNAIMNRFIGGTSEANGNINLLLETPASENTFDGIDLEVAASTVGLVDKGDRNAFNEILNSDLTQIQATANSSRFSGGIFNGISDSGAGTKLLDLSYGSNGGVISELGTGQERMRCYNITGAAFDDNKTQTLKIKTGATIKKHLSVIAGLGFAAPAVVPGFTAGTNVTVTGAALGDTVVVSANVAAVTTQWLVGSVTAADTVTLKWGQLSGAAATPGIGGETYRIDVWGH